MADVSVRFAVAGDAEIVLNLTVPQALRLVEALACKTADAVSAGDSRPDSQPPTGAIGMAAWPAPGAVSPRLRATGPMRTRNRSTARLRRDDGVAGIRRRVPPAFDIAWTAACTTGPAGTRHRPHLRRGGLSGSGHCPKLKAD